MKSMTSDGSTLSNGKDEDSDSFHTSSSHPDHEQKRYNASHLEDDSDVAISQNANDAGSDGNVNKRECRRSSTSRTIKVGQRRQRKKHIPSNNIIRFSHSGAFNSDSGDGDDSSSSNHSASEENAIANCRTNRRMVKTMMGGRHEKSSSSLSDNDGRNSMGTSSASQDESENGFNGDEVGDMSDPVENLSDNEAGHYRNDCNMEPVGISASRMLNFSPPLLRTSLDPDSSYCDDEEDHAEDEISSSSESDDDVEGIVVDKIIARRRDTIEKWKLRCRKMNTSEIENGSLWRDKSNRRQKQNQNDMEERFLVKWAYLSYLHCSWEREDVLAQQTSNGVFHMNTFKRKFGAVGCRFDADERGGGEYFDPELLRIDRILDIHADEDTCVIIDKTHPEYDRGSGCQFLIKWQNTPYSDSTYEHERDLIMMNVEYKQAKNEFLRRSKKPCSKAVKDNIAEHDRLCIRLWKSFRSSKPKNGSGVNAYVRELEGREFPNGGKLRDYQAEGVAWLICNYVNGRSSILADEMGLGKTIQTAAFLSNICCKRGPYLIVAPLSTVVQWQREISKWTDLNVVLYTGNAADRAMILEYEFAYKDDRPKKLKSNQKYLKNCHNNRSSVGMKTWMVQVVITTPEIMLTKDRDELHTIDWEMLIVDEAHNKLKSRTSKFSQSVQDKKFLYRHCLLLTGTPIQNNLDELWSLLNVIDPRKFANNSYFLGRYGNMRGKKRVDELLEVIRPYILRRLKEDVEKDLPAKEETIIKVELTTLQKKYYRALYEKNYEFLQQNQSRTHTANLLMELRKCANHPFLLEGVEDEAKKNIERKGLENEADFLVKSSGKLVLLDKFLPKLKLGGHRVLIFSQFRIMLDIIEDYLVLKEFQFERIDGSITGKLRQMAIDKFQTSKSSFIMLLTTKAGGVGINLTSADTVIIFDSDWNPQNDLQAQARCHRIGQKKSVKVYRFLTRKTCEMRLFHLGSLKMGLDKAILLGVENKREDNLTEEQTKRLLRYGAYDVFSKGNESSDANSESRSFVEEDIETILMRRTERRVHNANNKGFNFNIATFNAGKDDSFPHDQSPDIDVDDPDFWLKILKPKGKNGVKVKSPESINLVVHPTLRKDQLKGDDEESPSIERSKVHSKSSSRTLSGKDSVASKGDDDNIEVPEHVSDKSFETCKVQIGPPVAKRSSGREESSRQAKRLSSIDDEINKNNVIKEKMPFMKKMAVATVSTVVEQTIETKESIAKRNRKLSKQSHVKVISTKKKRSIENNSQRAIEMVDSRDEVLRRAMCSYGVEKKGSATSKTDENVIVGKEFKAEPLSVKRKRNSPPLMIHLMPQNEESEETSVCMLDDKSFTMSKLPGSTSKNLAVNRVQLPGKTVCVPFSMSSKAKLHGISRTKNTINSERIHKSLSRASLHNAKVTRMIASEPKPSPLGHKGVQRKGRKLIDTNARNRKISTRSSHKDAMELSWAFIGSRDGAKCEEETMEGSGRKRRRSQRQGSRPEMSVLEKMFAKNEAI